jgi:hypothetical protein
MFRYRRSGLFVIVLCLLGVSLSNPAQAQGRSYRSSKQTRLTSQDLDAMDAATKQLLDRPQLFDGAFAVWNSPSSGASGSIVAGPALTRHSLPCRRLTYFTNVPGPAPLPDRTTELTWCKAQEGWKIG